MYTAQMHRGITVPEMGPWPGPQPEMSIISLYPTVHEKEKPTTCVSDWLSGAPQLGLEPRTL